MYILLRTLKWEAFWEYECVIKTSYTKSIPLTMQSFWIFPAKSDFTIWGGFDKGAENRTSETLGLG